MSSSSIAGKVGAPTVAAAGQSQKAEFSLTDAKIKSVFSQLDGMQRAHEQRIQAKMAEFDRPFALNMLIGFLCLIGIGIIIHLLLASKKDKAMSQVEAENRDIERLEHMLLYLFSGNLDRINDENFKALLKGADQVSRNFPKGGISVNGTTCNSLRKVDFLLRRSGCSIFDRIKIISMCNMGIFGEFSEQIANLNPKKSTQTSLPPVLYAPLKIDISSEKGSPPVVIAKIEYLDRRNIQKNMKNVGINHYRFRIEVDIKNSQPKFSQHLVIGSSEEPLYQAVVKQSTTNRVKAN